MFFKFNRKCNKKDSTAVVTVNVIGKTFHINRGVSALIDHMAGNDNGTISINEIFESCSSDKKHSILKVLDFLEGNDCESFHEAICVLNGLDILRCSDSLINQIIQELPNLKQESIDGMIFQLYIHQGLGI